MPLDPEEERARVRRNQRKSRARKQAYVKDLEQRWQECVDLGVKISSHVQHAARKVHMENGWLRELLREQGIDDDTINKRLEQFRSAQVDSTTTSDVSSPATDMVSCRSACPVPPLRPPLVPPKKSPQHSPLPSKPQSIPTNAPSQGPLITFPNTQEPSHLPLAQLENTSDQGLMQDDLWILQQDWPVEFNWDLDSMADISLPPLEANDESTNPDNEPPLPSSFLPTDFLSPDMSSLTMDVSPTSPITYQPEHNARSNAAQNPFSGPSHG